MKPNDSNTLYALHTNFNGSIEKISDHAGNIGKANPLSYSYFCLVRILTGKFLNKKKSGIATLFY